MHRSRSKHSGLFWTFSPCLFTLTLFFIPSTTSAEEPTSGSQNLVKDEAEVKSLVEKLQSSYDKAIGFKAEFDQIFKSAQGGIRTKSTGKIFFHKPMMVRWEYETPNKKLFIANGDEIWIYDPEDNQVMHGKNFSKDQLTVALSFLRGKGKIEENFTVSIHSRFATGWTLKLVPKKEQGNLSALFLDLSNASFLVNAIEVEDALGNKNRFNFHKIGVGKDVAPAALFDYTPPIDSQVTQIPESYLK